MNQHKECSRKCNHGAWGASPTEGDHGASGTGGGSNQQDKDWRKGFDGVFDFGDALNEYAYTEGYENAKQYDKEIKSHIIAFIEKTLAAHTAMMRERVEGLIDERIGRLERLRNGPMTKGQADIGRAILDELKEEIRATIKDI